MQTQNIREEIKSAIKILQECRAPDSVQMYTGLVAAGNVRKIGF